MLPMPLLLLLLSPSTQPCYKEDPVSNRVDKQQATLSSEPDHMLQRVHSLIHKREHMHNAHMPPNKYFLKEIPQEQNNKETFTNHIPQVLTERAAEKQRRWIDLTKKPFLAV